ncbi:MAG: hypothetical protein IBX70_14365 [Clostridia bacterium]|nr:hypothetical protein [Clostridia bacterium]
MRVPLNFDSIGNDAFARIDFAQAQNVSEKTDDAFMRNGDTQPRIGDALTVK